MKVYILLTIIFAFILLSGCSDNTLAPEQVIEQDKYSITQEGTSVEVLVNGGFSERFIINYDPTSLSFDGVSMTSDGVMVPVLVEFASGQYHYLFTTEDGTLTIVHNIYPDQAVLYLAAEGDYDFGGEQVLIRFFNGDASKEMSLSIIE